jgi:hypothetical protein
LTGKLISYIIAIHTQNKEHKMDNTTNASTTANTNTTAQWYVFDEYDCMYGPCPDVMVAATEADSLVASAYTGVHIAYMTPAQFKVYCITADIRKAYNA